MNAAVENSYWMPFTANRDFNKKPRVINGAAGHWYTTEDGARLYDTFSGLWTSGIGHCHPKIVEAVQKTAAGISEIAEQTESQSASAGQVQNAIKSVSETTESNAASAEELAASAEQLGAQSQMLQDLVAKFEG